MGVAFSFFNMQPSFLSLELLKSQEKITLHFAFSMICWPQFNNSFLINSILIKHTLMVSTELLCFLESRMEDLLMNYFLPVWLLSVALLQTVQH